MQPFPDTPKIQSALTLARQHPDELMHLEQVARLAGLLFDAFAFSDEVGRSKPNEKMFTTAADLLGVKPGEMAHVGDRESNDVEGPHAVGARAILVTVVKDRRTGPSKADAICEDYRELPRLLEAQNAGGE